MVTRPPSRGDVEPKLDGDTLTFDVYGLGYRRLEAIGRTSTLGHRLGAQLG
ncbi:MAG: hypothetical protein AABN95_10550 [Acidobacteriota bacterium]